MFLIFFSISSFNVKLLGLEISDFLCFPFLLDYSGSQVNQINPW